MRPDTCLTESGLERDESSHLIWSAAISSGPWGVSRQRRADSCPPGCASDIVNEITKVAMGAFDVIDPRYRVLFEHVNGLSVATIER